MDRTEKYCIVGAGSSGLAVAKNFRQAGIALRRPGARGRRGRQLVLRQTGQQRLPLDAFDLVEAAHRVHRLPDARRTIPNIPATSRPGNICDPTPGTSSCTPQIEFNRSVESIERSGERLDDCACRRRGPPLRRPGDRQRPQLGSADSRSTRARSPGLRCTPRKYKTPDVLRGRRVLVVGAGNSGCDIAVEAAQNAAATFHSLRRGYHYLPKFLLGKPTDQCGERLLGWRLPLWLRRLITRRVVHLALGGPRVTDCLRPTTNCSRRIRSSTRRCCITSVTERSTSSRTSSGCAARTSVSSTAAQEAIDVLIYATGFQINFPFIDRKYLNWTGRAPRAVLERLPPRVRQLVCSRPDPARQRAMGAGGLPGAIDRPVHSGLPPRARPCRALPAIEACRPARPGFGHSIRFFDPPLARSRALQLSPAAGATNSIAQIARGGESQSNENHRDTEAQRGHEAGYEADRSRSPTHDVAML